MPATKLPSHAPTGNENRLCHRRVRPRATAPFVQKRSFLKETQFALRGRHVSPKGAQAARGRHASLPHARRSHEQLSEIMAVDVGGAVGVTKKRISNLFQNCVRAPPRDHPLPSANSAKSPLLPACPSLRRVLGLWP